MATSKATNSRSITTVEGYWAILNTDGRLQKLRIVAAAGDGTLLALGPDSKHLVPAADAVPGADLLYVLHSDDMKHRERTADAVDIPGRELAADVVAGADVLVESRERTGQELASSSKGV